jgi:hypothetical protein
MLCHIAQTAEQIKVQWFILIIVSNSIIPNSRYIDIRAYRSRKTYRAVGLVAITVLGVGLPVI